MRTFLVIWLGQLVSTVGSGLTSFALGVWVYQGTGSTTLYALNVLAFTLPGIVLAPLIGSLVDRLDRRLVMIAGDVGAGLTTLTIWALFASGQLQVWHVYAATFANAAFNCLQGTAHSAIVCLIVPKEQLGRASGLRATAEAIGMLLSPVLAGALYLSIQLAGIVLIDFATFCFAIVTLLLVRIPRPAPSPESRGAPGAFWQELTLGWRYIAARPGLAGLLVYFASLYFIIGMTQPLLNTMFLDLAGPETLGALLSAMGAGYLGGTLLMSAWGGPRRRILGILGVGIVQGVLMIGLGISTSLTILAGISFLFSLVDPIVGCSSEAFWQAKVPADIQGRVFAARRMIAETGLASSLLLVGPLVENVFEPLLAPGGALAGTVGQMMGTGAGRSTGLVFIVLGACFAFFSILGLLYAPLRLADIALPDAVQWESQAPSSAPRESPMD